MNTNNKIIGIDLGTTNSVLAIIEDGAPKLLPIQGNPLLPSVVGISPRGEVLVGHPARNQWVVAPENTIRSIKRKMGKGETVSMAGRDYTPQEISAFILREIKQAVETEVGHPIERAVITVPAYFNEVQRQATIEAGEIAGLRVERIINEPTAAALAYGLGVGEDANMRILVYDLGGGTFDVSIIELNYGVVDVLATAGDNFLGGDDFDERLANHIADQFAKANNVDLRRDHQAWVRLLRAAEETKIQLSADPYATMTLEYIAQDRRGNPLHVRQEVQRSEFEGLIDDQLQRTITCIDQALSDAKLEVKDIDRVLLVGGSTRIPAVWRLVSQRMRKDPHIEIDPDAAVALGAAVQAGIIAGEELNAILVDVTPLSLGIETATIGFTGQLQIDRYVPLILRNTTIPAQHSEVFTTLHPGQNAIQVKVYQGENKVASKNTLLGDFMVNDLKPNRPDGLCEVVINFQIDINGILNVTVTERGSNKQVTEQLKADRKRLSPEQISASQARMASLYEEAESEEEDEQGYVDVEIDEEDVRVIDGEAEEVEGDDEPLVLDAGTRALLDRAQRVLNRPGLTTALSAQIRGVVHHIQSAAERGDEELVESYCDELIDCLVEAEE